MRGHHRFVGGLAWIAVAAVASGCGDDPRQNGAVTTPPASGGAILNSDFLSTSLSLVDKNGGLVTADCVHSSTTGTGSTTISGDVVLPSQPQRGGQIVLIDRGNTALTFVTPSCTVDRQFSVKGGFEMANPHDVVIIDDHKAYVTRYAKNAAPPIRWLRATICSSSIRTTGRSLAGSTSPRTRRRSFRRARTGRSSRRGRWWSR